MKFALGMYTVLDEMKADLAGTLHAVKKAGYDGIEMFGPFPEEPDKLVALLKENELELCGWHTDWSLLKPAKLSETIALHQAIGNNVLVIPALGGSFNIGHNSVQNCCEIWRRHAREMNEISARLADAGMQLGYHNHSHEFREHFDNLSVWEILLQDTEKSIFLQLDTGNCLAGGGNVSKTLKQLAGRMFSLHAKPYAKNEQPVNIGAKDDENNWKAFLKLAQKGGCAWIVVENEYPFENKQASIAADLAGLKAFLK